MTAYKCCVISGEQRSGAECIVSEGVFGYEKYSAAVGESVRATQAT